MKWLACNARMITETMSPCGTHTLRLTMLLCVYTMIKIYKPSRMPERNAASHSATTKVLWHNRTFLFPDNVRGAFKSPKNELQFCDHLQPRLIWRNRCTWYPYRGYIESRWLFCCLLLTDTVSKWTELSGIRKGCRGKSAKKMKTLLVGNNVTLDTGQWSVTFMHDKIKWQEEERSDLALEVGNFMFSHQYPPSSRSSEQNIRLTLPGQLHFYYITCRLTTLTWYPKLLFSKTSHPLSSKLQVWDMVSTETPFHEVLIRQISYNHSVIRVNRFWFWKPTAFYFPKIVSLDNRFPFRFFFCGDRTL